jgi:hypothetical protein
MNSILTKSTMEVENSKKKIVDDKLPLPSTKEEKKLEFSDDDDHD